MGDSWTNHLDSTHTYTSVVTNTYIIHIFDMYVRAKNIHIDVGIIIHDEVWTDEFGLIKPWSSTAEQISKSIEAIINVTNETSSGIQQVAKAAEDLNMLTDNLQKLVGQFKIDDNKEKSHYSSRKNIEMVEL